MNKYRLKHLAKKDTKDLIKIGEHHKVAVASFLLGATSILLIDMSIDLLKDHDKD